MHRETLNFQTKGRGLVDIGARIDSCIGQSKVSEGMCNLFLRHTSASLILCENSDPQVQRDLERFVGKWIPEKQGLYEHSQEGLDDMPAHLRSVFTLASLSIPIAKGRLALGTWQGIFLWEHRIAPHQRTLLVTAWGQ